jgi:hypothetical protein
MLRRKEAIGETMKVRELPPVISGEGHAPLAAETREATENRAAREKQRLDRLKTTLAREFVEAGGQVDRLARANDNLLRLVLRLLSSIRDSRDSMDAFYRDLCQRISSESLSRGLTGAAQHAREEIFKLRPSIEQLIGFLETTAKSNPNVLFATSPELDIEYLVDLLVGEAVWDKEKNCLRMRLKLIQAKSRVLDEKSEKEKIRELVEKHRSAANILLTEFGLDTKWIRGYISRLEERSAIERIVLSFDETFTLLTDGESGPSIKQGRSPFEMFLVQETSIKAVNDLARELEVPERPLPEIVLDSMSFVFLVTIKTKDGRAVFKELTLEEALKY